MAFLSDENFYSFFSLLLMWALCHSALQGFAFIFLGSITESSTHLHVSQSPPLRSGIKISTCAKRQSIPSASVTRLINHKCFLYLNITTFTSTPQLFQTSASLTLIHHCHVCHFVYSCSYMDVEVILKTDAIKWITALQDSVSLCCKKKCKQPVLFTVVCSYCPYKSNG